MMAFKSLSIIVFLLYLSILLSVYDAKTSDATNKIYDPDSIQRVKRSNSFTVNTCRDINSCKEDIFYRRCNCDHLCTYYGDCCWDASPNTTLTQDDIPKMSCVPLTREQSFWVVSDCPDYQEDAELRAKCRKDLSVNVYSPDIALPVWSTSRKMAYQNRYCAKCNDANDVVPYNISVRGFNWGCKRPHTSSPMDVIKNYLQQNSSCVVDFLHDDIEQRQCFSGLISTCSSNDSQTQERCEHGPINPVYTLHTTPIGAYGSFSTGFRNYDCYVCSSFYPFPSLSCVQRANYEMFPMMVLIDTEDLTTDHESNQNTVCGKEQVYDHIYVRIF